MQKLIDKLINLFVLDDKPDFATAKQWAEWENKAMIEQPFAYWLDDTVRPWIKRNTVTRLNDLRYYIRCRVFDRYHVIKTGLEPGYADTDRRMLHGMFNLLVDFVEVEKAWMHVVFDEEERKKRKHPWWSLGWTRFKAFRDPQAGLDHLAWEMTLDDPKLPAHERSDHQAVQAREIAILYDWWKNIRPNRPEPYDVSGWSDICERRRQKRREGNESKWTAFDWDDETPEEKAETKKALDESRRIEQSYDDEDEEMLIRLIKIRKGLWT